MAFPECSLSSKTKKNFSLLLTPVLIFLSVLTFYKTGGFESFELLFFDRLIQHHRAKQVNSPITVITITENDFRRLKRWSISDELLSVVLRRLIKYKALVIGVDMYRDFPVPPGQQKLETVFSQNQNIIVLEKFGDVTQGGFLPPKVLRNTGQVGFSDILPDRDGVVRRGLLFLDDGKKIFHSFAFRISQVYLKQQGILPQPDPVNPSFIQLGEVSIKPFHSNDGGYVEADDGGYQFFLDFCQPPKAIKYYDLTRFLKGDIHSIDFKEKIVLIGTVAKSHKDQVPTSCGDYVSGVLMHSAIVDQLLRIAEYNHSLITTTPDWLEELWVLFWVLLGGIVSFRGLAVIPLLLVWLGGLTILYTISELLFSSNRIWLIFFTPAFSWTLSCFFIRMIKATQEKQEKTQLMSLFSKYVAPEIAELIWQQQGYFIADGRPRPQNTIATVFFTDIQHFTALSETLTPEELYDWINEYLAEMTPLVTSHRGVVLRFIGDAIFCGFGIPVPSRYLNEIQRDAINAVNCAIAMNGKLVQLNKQWKKLGLPVVGMRIGIHTGPLITGSIGAKDRMEYTIHGDTVNTAARLESHNKAEFIPDLYKSPCRIYIGDTTRHHLDDKFNVKMIGNIKLHGKKQSIDIYTLNT